MKYYDSNIKINAANVIQTDMPTTKCVLKIIIED